MCLSDISREDLSPWQALDAAAWRCGTPANPLCWARPLPQTRILAAGLHTSSLLLKAHGQAHASATAAGSGARQGATCVRSCAKAEVAAHAIGAQSA